MAAYEDATVLIDNASMRVEKHTIPNNAYSDTPIQLNEAKTAYFVAQGALIFGVPSFDDTEKGVNTNGEGTYTGAVAMDIPASENVFAPTATKAGVIAEGHMPLFLLLKDTRANGSPNVCYVYIIKR